MLLHRASHRVVLNQTWTPQQLYSGLDRKLVLLVRKAIHVSVSENTKYVKSNLCCLDVHMNFPTKTKSYIQNVHCIDLNTVVPDSEWISMNCTFCTLKSDDWLLLVDDC